MASIKTYARIKPAKDQYDDYETTRNKLYLRIPDSYGRDSTLYNRTRAPIVNHEFKYSMVFNASSSQEEVFNVSAKNIIDGFLEGYNGTIFAYGQTSSGKTHTMHGDLSDSELKGLTPRSLSRIFDGVAARKEAGENITMHCSFLEIYQETGYDLLKLINKTTPGPTSFAKVTVVDGPEGAAVVKNLSIHAITSEEGAQALLAQGELNRKVAETAMNNRSSRSHAVFTVYLSSRKGDLLVRSKMHFVDLAGSERVCKTGVKGLQLSEAKYINLSLHYLEGVIIALHQHATSSGRLQTAPAGISKSWSASAKAKRPYSAAPTSDRPRHIPYRNSLLTMLLKDSLGGNCLTTMIANISLEMDNLSESISTCRFAQRVSCISNAARKNEEIDDKSMIKRLRTKVAELEAENNVLKHGGHTDLSTIDEQEKSRLTAEDKELCQLVVKDFLNGRLIDPIVAGVTDPFKFRECMSIFKRLIKEHSDKSLRLAEKLKQQPSHVQEAFYTGGRYHEAPLAKPNRRPEISFRDDANVLAKNVYAHWNPKRQRTATSLKPTILKNVSRNEHSQREASAEAWQLRLHDDPRPNLAQPNTTEFGRPKPQSAGAALRRAATPFERKKKQEVVQLNKKVEENFAQQLKETNHLKAFKQSVVEKELEILIQTLTRRLEVTQHQLNDQRRYILRLRKRSTDTNLVEQEQLVERQLEKRVSKIEAELNTTIRKLREIKTFEAENHNDVSVPQYRTVNDKFANVTKRDGSMDRVKVRTTLEKQQQFQNQLQKNIDQQRVLVIDKHLEVSEMSTRQKLEEFKRKLAESRKGKRSDIDEPGVRTQHSPDIDQPGVRTQHSSITSAQTINSKSSTQSKRLYKPLDLQSGTNLPKKFQNRIEEEKSLGDSEQSIGEILGKYRTPKAHPKQCEPVSERTAHVDHILAKYRSHQKMTNTTARNVKGSSMVKVHDQSHPAAKEIKTTAREIKTSQSDRVTSTSSASHSPAAYSTVRVANSAMQYRTDYIKKTAPDYRKAEIKDSFQVKRATQQRQESEVERDFDSTLKSMLMTRQGHHRKRTDAWKDDKPKDRELDKDVSKVKLHQYLSKQHKKKQHESLNNEKSKSRSDMQSSKRHNSNQTQLVKTRRISSEDSRSEFSHRMSHYQRKLDSNNPATGTVDIHRDSRQLGAGNTDIHRDSSKLGADNTDIHRDSSKLGAGNTDIAQPESASKPEAESSYTPKIYRNLLKMNKRNEHSSKVRQIQNAAVTIQRAWRRHLCQAR